LSIFSWALQLKIHPQQGFKRLACIEVHLGPSTPSELSTTAELLNHAHTQTIVARESESKWYTLGRLTWNLEITHFPC